MFLIVFFLSLSLFKPIHWIFFALTWQALWKYWFTQTYKSSAKIKIRKNFADIDCFWLNCGGQRKTGKMYNHRTVFSKVCNEECLCVYMSLIIKWQLVNQNQIGQRREKEKKNLLRLSFLRDLVLDQRTLRAKYDYFDIFRWKSLLTSLSLSLAFFSRTCYL